MCHDQTSEKEKKDEVRGATLASTSSLEQHLVLSSNHKLHLPMNLIKASSISGNSQII